MSYAHNLTDELGQPLNLVHRDLNPSNLLISFNGDVKIIDGLGPNGAAWASLKSAGRLAKAQSGYVYHYAFVMLLGVAGLLAFAIATWGG